MEKKIRQLLRYLQIEYVAVWVLPLLLVALYETGVMTEGAYAGDVRMDYVLQTVGILLAVGLIPLSLRLFSLSLVKNVKQRSLPEALKSYRRWSEIRTGMLVVPVLVNLSFYYLTLNNTGVLCAMMALIASLFCVPSADKIKEDIRFISEKLQSNREQIAKLEKQLKNSQYNSAQLKKAVANLTKELEAKQQQIETLQAELASKNIRIAELDDAVAGLSQNVSELTAENEAKAATVASQDKALNAAWFVFGTKSELKDQKILEKGDVLKSADFNKDYFTQIDIRTDKEIKLYSKRAELLTTHPAGSYELVKDAKGQLTLKITNPTEFWSVSRYLVIQVK